MDKCILVSLAFLASSSAWSQAAPAATGAAEEQDVTSMHTPPWAGEAMFSSERSGEDRTNLLRVVVTAAPAYNDNVLPYQSEPPVSDSSFTYSSTVSFDRSRPRLRAMFSYTPQVTVYRRSSVLNNLSHDFSGELSLRTSRHATVTLRESFDKSTGVFGPSFASWSQSAGGALAASQGAIAPWASQMHSSSSGDIVYQYSRSRMIGASGAATQLIYMDGGGGEGLCDANSRSGSGFYNIRLTPGTYAGASYGYATYGSCSGVMRNGTETHTIDLFFSYYSRNGISLSISGGPQRYTADMTSLPSPHQWTPNAAGNIAWQGNWARFTAAFSRTVAGAGGLVGSYRTLEADSDIRIQMTRSWSAAAAVTYQQQKNVNPQAPASIPGGHSLLSTLSLGRSFAERIRAELQYQRIHQSYGTLAPQAVPNANRISIALSYRFERPLGR